MAYDEDEGPEFPASIERSHSRASGIMGDGYPRPEPAQSSITNPSLPLGGTWFGQCRPSTPIQPCRASRLDDARRRQVDTPSPPTQGPRLLYERCSEHHYRTSEPGNRPRPGTSPGSCAPLVWRTISPFTTGAPTATARGPGWSYPPRAQTIKSPLVATNPSHAAPPKSPSPKWVEAARSWTAPQRSFLPMRLINPLSTLESCPLTGVPLPPSTRIHFR
ncbi:hypothetical protein L227DRAFT_373153 [Lentinus tigrinus ALCF2SS1-6]|uniref:Uncharacterized protein n=1 Tax=Lentinus tigrinus ALCF2SS1-6 TaxID=1328759 RepID=A0A5C2RU93_9APHY|nr:hypothetical protein L227DRAFT_373153 [Lentinus tigrinus ALCF2SS1-6]